jgi:hypothetical protein
MMRRANARAYSEVRMCVYAIRYVIAQVLYASPTADYNDFETDARSG